MDEQRVEPDDMHENVRNNWSPESEPLPADDSPPRDIVNDNGADEAGEELSRRHSDSDAALPTLAQRQDGHLFITPDNSDDHPLTARSIRPSYSSSDLLLGSLTTSSSAPPSLRPSLPRPASRNRLTQANSVATPHRITLPMAPKPEQSIAARGTSRQPSSVKPQNRVQSRSKLHEAPLKAQGLKSKPNTPALVTVVPGRPSSARGLSIPPVVAQPAPQKPPAAAGLSKLAALQGKLPGKPEPVKRMAFVPAQKLDPKQLKEAVRRWYHFDSRGKMTIIQAGKYELTQSLGVHSRDLRILDANSSNSSYPSCILCREHALVINLEYIQVIVTTNTTLVLNAERANEPLVKSFVQDLQRRLAEEEGGGEHGGCDDDDDDLLCEKERALRQTEEAANMAASARDAQEAQMPYELKVLEVCLDHIATAMSDHVKGLEEDSSRALERLTAKVNALNLEAVRRVKNGMVRLSTRVETIRVLLEKYLGDDDDLAELHLSGQQVVEEQFNEKVRQRDRRRDERMHRYSSKRERKLAGDPNASEPSSISNSTFTLSEEDRGWLSSQAEMVIEPYFMSFDNTWNRLQAIGEFIDDTEDYVNITLDSHRNQLIQVDLLLTAASFCVGLMTLIAGIFGMNLRSGYEMSAATFNLVSILSCTIAIVLLVFFIALMRMKRLAFV